VRTRVCVCVLGGSKLLQKFCVSGHISELIFQVEFQLSEVKVSRLNPSISVVFGEESDPDMLTALLF